MKRLAPLTALAGILLVAGGVVFLAPILNPDLGSLDTGFVVVLFGGLGFYWVLGAIIVLRADGHTIGWLFVISAAMLATVFGCWTGSGVAALADPGGPLQAWFVLAGALLFPPAMTLALPAVTITFPTGSLPGPRWRWPIRCLVAVVVAQMLATLLLMNPLLPWTALPGFVIDIVSLLGAVGGLSIPFGLALGVIAVVVRFRRSLGDERAQLKWLLAAAVPAAVLIPLSLSEVGAEVPGIDAISAATLPLAAVAVAIAILRYRLYDIDRIISRTLGYGIVTAVLFALFWTVNLGLQGVLSAATRSDPLVVAVSTLLVAALFQPIRRRVQAVVDRRFNRARYDAERTVERFSGRLRDGLDLSTLAGELQRTTSAAVQPTTSSVWLRAGGPR